MDKDGNYRDEANTGSCFMQTQVQNQSLTQKEMELC